MLDALLQMLQMLPAGVALTCMEAAVASGLIIRGGEIFPWDATPTSPDNTDAHCRP